MNHIRQVTVFGGSGFIGRAIVRALAPTGVLIRVACRRIELAEPIKTAGDVGQITVMRANLRGPPSVANAIAGSQAVINATGIPFEHGRQRYQAVHLAGARTLPHAPPPPRVPPPIHVSRLRAAARDSKKRHLRSKVARQAAARAGLATATILRP